VVCDVQFLLGDIVGDIWWPLGSAGKGRISWRKWRFKECTELVDDVGDDILVSLRQLLAFLMFSKEIKSACLGSP